MLQKCCNHDGQDARVHGRSRVFKTCYSTTPMVYISAPSVTKKDYIVRCLLIGFTNTIFNEYLGKGMKQQSKEVETYAERNMIHLKVDPAKSCQ